MNDLISRQAAIDAMTSILWHYPNECYRNLNEYEFAKWLAELGLKSVPPAQPEIIRCRDCKFLRLTGLVWKCQNRLVMMLCDPNDYCSRAERKEE